MLNALSNLTVTTDIARYRTMSHDCRRTLAEEPSIAVPLLLTRSPDAPPQTLAEYRAAGGYAALAKALGKAPANAPARTASSALAKAPGHAPGKAPGNDTGGALAADDVLHAVADARLHGHGGAGFPTARKWELARAATETPKYVIVNGGEHEPGSRKDRLLLTQYPHTVLEGAALCAYATGASTIYFYLIEDMTAARASVQAAIADARAAQLVGDLEFEITLAPATYVAGEETAALEVIEGRKAWPRKKPPYPGQVGLFGKPTTVNNVETLAFVPGIVRNGPAWFGAGAMLCTLDESFKHPGVVEVPLGTSFRALIHDIGGGTRGGRPVRAILPAMSSAFLSASALDTPMTYPDVRRAGSNLGCGGISLLEDGQCVVEKLVAISEFFMREQCGQCPPCRMETNTLAAILRKVVAGDPGDYRAQIVKIAEFTRGRGNCNLIEMAAAPVLSALAHFPDDFEFHVAHGRCRS
jgi:NADH:ubiquinone oxidoreductase subunit F (NADH-binding)